ncbi:hypothetical protein [Streptomyces violascens]|uniref:hypothetical protein n=1 Tax=Streptomyces violascens TaxID=67381 RepID=UPI0016756E8E|nr:hypothetical protein [Streptomyces violascens]
MTPAREVVPDGGRFATVAPGPLWPDPVQPPARETLAPAYSPAPTTTATEAAEPLDRPGREHPARDADAGHHGPAQHGTGHPPAAVRRPSPVPRPPRQRPQPDYDPGTVCSWAQGAGIDPPVVRACQQELAR